MVTLEELGHVAPDLAERSSSAQNRSGFKPGGADAALTEYLAALSSWDPAPGRGMVFSAHQMGTARAGADPASHPCDPDGRVRAGGTPGAGVVAGLFVADTSLFPTAAGVNPMITTMLLARRVARPALAEDGVAG